MEPPGDVIAAGQPLLGGTGSPQVVSLRPGQRRALGAFVVNGAPFCTGWLASARHAVTAAHCFPAATRLDAVDFVVQLDDGTPVVLPLSAMVQHPSLDVSVAVLGAAPAAALGLEPLPLNRAPLSGADVGKPVEVAGAGFGTTPAQGLSFGVFSVLSVGEARIEIDTSSPRGPCRGDSGGPYLMALDAEVRVVAIESEGAVDCQGPNWGVRADRFADWLGALVAAVPAEDSVPCAADRSWCEGALQRQCRAGWSRTRDCAALGASCGWLGPSTGEGCLPPACGALDGHGECQAGLARWCSGGHVEQLDCAARDLGCTFDGAAGRVGCVSCPACAGECVDLRADVRHCGACGVRCAVRHGTPGCVQGACVVNGCDEGFVVVAGRCVLSAAEPRDEQQVMLAVQQGPSCRVTGDGPWLVAALAWAARRIRRSSGAGAQS